jgi:hypothetical protein
MRRLARAELNITAALELSPGDPLLEALRERLHRKQGALHRRRRANARRDAARALLGRAHADGSSNGRSTMSESEVDSE